MGNACVSQTQLGAGVVVVVWVKCTYSTVTIHNHRCRKNQPVLNCFSCSDQYWYWDMLMGNWISISSFFLNKNINTLHIIALNTVWQYLDCNYLVCDWWVIDTGSILDLSFAWRSWHDLSPVIVFEDNWSLCDQQKDWNNSAIFSFSDFHEPSVSYQHFFWSTPSDRDRSASEWRRGMIIMSISNSWLVLSHYSSHSQDSFRGQYTICQPTELECHCNN